MNLIIDIKLALFYMLSTIVIVSGLSVIVSKHPVKAVLSLVLAFVASSGLWLLINAEFLALALIVVYVGAVMVLFLFVVMMLDVDLSSMQEGFNKHFPLAIILSGSFFGILYYILGRGYFGLENFKLPALVPAEYSNTKQLGLELYTNYIYSFELAGAILMVAIIAAISLTFRGSKFSKKQNISKQTQATKADRLKIIKALK
ncbi:MAG: NADH-quinone oxidoreductase subunit J [Gammaproteobacteria bacterium]|nr:NADH-quinone oxidoreductase subunit J [Gammaproteobacteria bacterium]